MRIARDRMVKAALIVLDHAISQAHDAPIKPTAGLRFALSWLYANSQGERRPFSDFLLALQDDGVSTPREGERHYIRRTRIDSCFKGIIRAVGYPETPEAKKALTDAWQKR